MGSITRAWGRGGDLPGTDEHIVDRCEEQPGGLLGHPGQHPLPDPADHPAHHGVGVVVDPGAAVGQHDQVDPDGGVDGPGSTGTVGAHRQ